MLLEQVLRGWQDVSVSVTAGPGPRALGATVRNVDSILSSKGNSKEL